MTNRKVDIMWIKRISLIIVCLSTLLTFSNCKTNNPDYQEFLAQSKIEFKIPGLDSEFVPQGMCYIENNLFVISGYMDDGQASRLYVVNNKTNQIVKMVQLKYRNGDIFIGHAGGVASYGNHLWVLSNRHAFHLNVNHLLDADYESYMLFDLEVKTPTNATFGFASDEYLYVGEFYLDDSDNVSSAHNYQVNDFINHAIVCAYSLDPLSPDGLQSHQPKFVLSIPDKIQGMCVTSKGQYVLSSSYGRNNSSYLYVYNKDINGINDNTILIDSQSIPVYYLDKTSLQEAILCLPMSEGLEYVNERLYVLFESGAMKYQDGVYC